MRKLSGFLLLLALTGASGVGIQPAYATTYDECVAKEKKKMEYALPGESSDSIQASAEALCGGRPKERGSYQANKKRAQKLYQNGCLGKKHGFKCDTN